MHPIRITAASTLGIAVLVVAAAGCAHRAPKSSATAANSCERTPSLIIHNNTGGDVEVYEYRAGAKNVIATVNPGTHQVTLTSDDPRLSYGAQPVGRSQVLTSTTRSRASDRVRLERICA